MATCSSGARACCELGGLQPHGTLLVPHVPHARSPVVPPTAAPPLSAAYPLFLVSGQLLQGQSGLTMSTDCNFIFIQFEHSNAVKEW